MSTAKGESEHDATMTKQVETIPVLLLTPRQAASALGICERTLATYTKRGLLPVVRIGFSVRYSVEALREWIKGATEKKCGSGQNCT